MGLGGEMKFKRLDWPLMAANITKEDRNEVIRFLRADPILTNGPKVRKFEEAWSEWLGVKYSLFVNSGASANLLTMQYLKIENRYNVYSNILVPTLTWVSDISSVMHAGFTPVFIDIDPETLAMNDKEVERLMASTPHVRGVFITNVLGLCARYPNIPSRLLIEDCCECHGAEIDGKKLGTFGRISNFSFYFAHHMSTIEGGMVCTNDEEVYETIRMLRSHGMVREMTNEKYKKEWRDRNPTVHPAFLFAYPAFNCRSTEINAVIGLSQLKRLDENNEKRRKNFEVFLHELNPRLYRADFKTKGMSPYGLILVMREKDEGLRNKIEHLMNLCNVEFRRGLSGGGNQLRQPYLKHLGEEPGLFPHAEHVTDYSWYVGNYPELSHQKIKDLCKYLNQF